MVNFEGLTKSFASINLPLKIMSEPIVKTSGTDIVQIDIFRNLKGNNRGEIFRIYPGNETNLIQVMNTDNKVHQLVLHVKEPKRKFFNEVSPRDILQIKKKFGEVNHENISRHFGATRRKVMWQSGSCLMVMGMTD